MRTTIAILFCQLLCGWSFAQGLDTSRAMVELYVLSFIEDPLPEASIQLIERGSKKELSQKFTLSGARYTATAVPYGEYVLRVRRAGFRFHEQFLLVHQPRVSLRVFLPVARITDESPTEVQGSVRPAPGPNDRLWVKMLPLLTTEYIGEAEVEPDGRFRFTGLDEGEYVIVVMKGTHALYMRQVKLYGTVRITAELPPRSPDR